MGRCANLMITGAICMTLSTVVSCTGHPYLTLIEGPADQVFVEGSEREDVTFTCTTEGNPEPEIVWRKNDTRIEQSEKYQITDNGALVINNPVRGDHGDRFRCVAQNAFGALRSGEATLEIAYMDTPSDTEVPNVNVPTSEGVCLDCSPPNAYPGIQVKWTKDNNNIEFIRRRMVLADGRLCFAHTMENDGGRYSCSVTNSYAHDQGQRIAFKRSTSVNLGVSGGRSNQQLAKVEVPANVMVKRGEDAVLQCIFRGNPLPTLQWTTDRPLDNEVATNSSQLRIPDAQPHHSGEYTCTATQDTSTLTTTQYLTVISPPILTLRLGDTGKGVANSVAFRCESDHPSDEYSWYYNAEPIQFDTRIQRKSNNTIFIKSALMGDSGIYQCSVSNRFGAVFSTAQLRITRARESTATPITNAETPEQGDTGVRESTASPTANTKTPMQGDTDFDDGGPQDQRESGGNSSVMLSGSAMLLLVGMICQKVF